MQIKRIVLWKKYYDTNLAQLILNSSDVNYTDKELWNDFDERFIITSITPTGNEEVNQEGVTVYKSDHNISSIYAFSSMFYTKLTETKKSQSYELVKKWTKNVNIFEKEFIFIPINIGSHWSLVCIVRPGCIRNEVFLFYQIPLLNYHYLLLIV